MSCSSLSCLLVSIWPHVNCLFSINSESIIKRVTNLPLPTTAAAIATTTTTAAAAAAAAAATTTTTTVLVLILLHTVTFFWMQLRRYT